MNENNKKYEYYSRKYLKDFFNTESLSYFENKISNDKFQEREKAVLASYLYFSKKVNKYKYLNLWKLVNEFDDAVKNKNELNKMYNVFLTLNSDVNKYKYEEEFKKKIQLNLKKFLNETNLSLKFVVDKFDDLSYSNVYNFLNKDLYSALSREKLMKIFNFIEEYNE